MQGESLDSDAELVPAEELPGSGTGEASILDSRTVLRKRQPGKYRVPKPTSLWRDSHLTGNLGSLLHTVFD